MTTAEALVERAHVTIVADRSGSMARTKEEAEGGIQQFLDAQRALDRVDVTVTLMQFDTEFDTVYSAVPVADAPRYVLEPRGWTALYDAVGKAIIDTMADLQGRDVRPGKVVVVVATDGFENSSREYNQDAIRQLVKLRQADGWEIIFLSGTLDTVRFSEHIGTRSSAYDPNRVGSTQSAYAAAGVATADYLQGTTRSVEVSDVDDLDK